MDNWLLVGVLAVILLGCALAYAYRTGYDHGYVDGRLLRIRRLGEGDHG